MISKKKIKVALVITGLGVGGAERVVVDLADGLVSRGHDVLLVYLTGQATVQPKNSAIKIVGLGLRSVLGVFGAYRLLRNLLRTFNPDVVHGHMVHANILVRLLRLTLPLPCIITTAHNSNEGGWLRMLAYRWTDRLADLSTNVSEEAVAVYLQKRAVKPGRMVAVHNGVDTEKYRFLESARRDVRRELGVPDGTTLLLAVGRLNKQKDYPNLFHALSRLGGPASDCQLFLAGDGVLRAALAAQVDALGLQSCVHFLGIRHDVARLYSAADVFVLSSAWEGFSLVTAEAMACERVVVVTDCGGVGEVVGDAGYLVPPRQPEALAESLRAAISMTAEEKRHLGQVARERVCRLYSVDAALEKWVSLYFGCLGETTSI